MLWPLPYSKITKRSSKTFSQALSGHILNMKFLSQSTLSWGQKVWEAVAAETDWKHKALRNHFWNDTLKWQRTEPNKIIFRDLDDPSALHYCLARTKVATDVAKWFTSHDQKWHIEYFTAKIMSFSTETLHILLLKLSKATKPMKDWKGLLLHLFQTNGDFHPRKITVYGTGTSRILATCPLFEWTWFLGHVRNSHVIKSTAD